MQTKYFAGVEAGGTKFLCAIVNEAGETVEEIRIDTRGAEETLVDVDAFFACARRRLGKIEGAGIGTFGPVDLDANSSEYGRIVSTPKPGWSGADILGAVRSACDAPTAIDTDVNAAALAEILHGAGHGLSDLCYVTVGTGIGVGIISGGRSVGSHMHPEVGHIRVPHAPGDTFVGTCPYHNDCLEGLACGPAMKARWGVSVPDLPDNHPAWAMQAHYVAHLCANLTYTVRPQRIVIGGGVFGRTMLYGLTRAVFADLIGGYAPGPADDPDTFIVAPGLTHQPPGLVGAIALARRQTVSSNG